MPVVTHKNKIPADLENSYIQVENKLAPYIDNGWTSAIQRKELSFLIARLSELHIKFMPVRLPKNATPRLGATVIVFGREPLIWVDVARHRNEEDLIDTICHEAVHATALHLNRWNSLPDQSLDKVNYQAEEIIARLGANEVARRIGYKTGSNVSKNNDEAACQRRFLKREGWSAEDIKHLDQLSNDAAAYLADFEKHATLNENLASQLRNVGLDIQVRPLKNPTDKRHRRFERVIGWWKSARRALRLVD